MAVLVIAISAAYADHQNKIVSDQAARADVLVKVNLIRAKLEGNINGNLQLVHGLVATVVTEPYMGQQRFASLEQYCRRARSGRFLDVPAKGQRESGGPRLPQG